VYLVAISGRCRSGRDVSSGKKTGFSRQRNVMKKIGVLGVHVTNCTVSGRVHTGPCT